MSNDTVEGKVESVSRGLWMKERKSHERKNDVAVFLRVEGGSSWSKRKREGALTHKVHPENESNEGAGHSRGPDLQHPPPSQIRTPHCLRPASALQTTQCRNRPHPASRPTAWSIVGFRQSRFRDFLATPLSALSP